MISVCTVGVWSLAVLRDRTAHVQTDTRTAQHMADVKML